MPLYHYGRIPRPGRLVCTLWFHRPGRCRRERSSTDVSRHTNNPYGSQGPTVGCNCSKQMRPALVALRFGWGFSFLLHSCPSCACCFRGKLFPLLWSESCHARLYALAFCCLTAGRAEGIRLYLLMLWPSAGGCSCTWLCADDGSILFGGDTESRLGSIADRCDTSRASCSAS
jgi:hypothetical protein